MRTTVNLDSDVYSFTAAYADAKGITLSAALCELVRRAEQISGPASKSSRLKMNRHGYLVVPASGDVLTPILHLGGSEHSKYALLLEGNSLKKPRTL